MRPGEGSGAEVWRDRGRMHLLLGRVEAGARVEERRAEAQVELLVGLDDVVRCDLELGPDARAVVGHVRGALQQLARLQDARVALLGGVDLLQQHLRRRGEV